MPASCSTRQRPARLGRGVQAQVQPILPRRKSLAGDGLEQLQLDVLVSGPD
ncbi:MAG: hypothetical protein ACRDP6_14105 [Actinoallomurus sp.]